MNAHLIFYYLEHEFQSFVLADYHPRIFNYRKGITHLSVENFHHNS